MKSKGVLIKLKPNQILNTAESPRFYLSSRFFFNLKENFDHIKTTKSCKFHQKIESMRFPTLIVSSGCLQKDCKSMSANEIQFFNKEPDYE